ncbi:hypothetical protein DNTS_021769 [Danionella cerebrum]|uniref:Cation efflux protein transmembrane domain-containing protein n=1 Tax=Danionella cerebrum TaxID=2873325 RepID=A0A553QPC8_9TELE|nr:hypothetical protein DNTS_021769 [Danionella translucida]
MAQDGSLASVAMAHLHSSPYHLHHHHSDHHSRPLGNRPDVVPSGVTERKPTPADKPDMVVLDVLGLTGSEPPLHRKKLEMDTHALGTIHPFRRPQRSVLGRFSQEFSFVTSDRRSWRILLFALLNLLCTGCLLMWCSSTNSMALTAYTYLTIFDLFSLMTCLLSLWVTMKKPSQSYSFGVERFVEQPEVHTGRLLVGTCVALFFNLLTLLSVKNKPFAFVSEAASTSWLQEHVADLSRSLCGLVPSLSSVLLPRMNPFVLINLAGAFALLITHTLIEINNYNAMDTASAVAIALMTFGTMYPMSVYSGKVLLQVRTSARAPLRSHTSADDLRVCFPADDAVSRDWSAGQAAPRGALAARRTLALWVQQVSTLDGVLEVRNEHFWTIGFGSLAGSLHVRIRRDADEQLVLAHVTHRLHALVHTLTVQILKDVSYSSHPLRPTHSPQLDSMPSPSTSTPTKSGNAPPEFCFHSPGSHSQLQPLRFTHPHTAALPSPYSSLLLRGLPPTPPLRGTVPYRAQMRP